MKKAIFVMFSTVLLAPVMSLADVKVYGELFMTCDVGTSTIEIVGRLHDPYRGMLGSSASTAQVRLYEDGVQATDSTFDLFALLDNGTPYGWELVLFVGEPIARLTVIPTVTGRNSGDSTFYYAKLAGDWFGGEFGDVPCEVTVK